MIDFILHLFASYWSYVAVVILALTTFGYRSETLTLNMIRKNQDADALQSRKTLIKRYNEALEKAKIPNEKIREENKMLGRVVDRQKAEITFLDEAIKRTIRAQEMSWGEPNGS